MAKGSNNIRGRSSDASKPYDVSNSFVKRVASRVTELLPQPSSWFSRWMSPSEVPNATEFVGHSLSSTITSRPPATSRAELNLADTVDHHAPAAKKPRTNRYNSPVNQKILIKDFKNQYNAEDISPIAVRGGEPIAGPSSRDTRPELVASTPAVPSQQIAAKVNGDDCSETSESTSGCSSLVPQAQSSGRSLGGSRYGRSFPGSSTVDALDRRRPSFNPTTFNSPLRASMRTRLGSSPFYSGRTMYGGSSQTCDYARMVETSQRQASLVRRVGPTVRPSSSQDSSLPLSSTAKRILDALEQFSTPMIDAKKMPVVGSKRTFHSMIGEQSQRRYAELNIPSTPDLLRVKRRERLQQSTLEARQTATQTAPVSTPVAAEYTIRREEPDGKKHTGKVKTKEKLDEEEPVAEVKLPTAVLAVDKLPKIDIAIPPPPAPITAPVVSIGSKYVFSQPMIVTSVVTPINVPTSTFKFSEPLRSSASISDKDSSSESFKTRTSTGVVLGDIYKKKDDDKNKNTFVDNKLVSDQKTSSAGFSLDANRPVSDCQFNFVTKTNEKSSHNWECSNCKNNNSSSSEICVSCQTNKNLKTPDTSKNNVKPSVTSGFGNFYKKPTGTWECSTCLIQNKGEATKCVACESAKPDKEKVDKKVSVSDAKPFTPQAPSESKQSGSGFGDMFKKPSGSWTCDTCMINNNADKDKCAACETPKPGAKISKTAVASGTSSEAKQSANGFGNLFKKPSGSWTCNECMIDNAADKIKCAACETPKPGAAIPKSVETSGPKFSFGIPSGVSTSSSEVGTTFSFGIPKGEQTSTSLNTNLSVPKSNTSDIAQTPTTFSFGIPKPVTTENNSSNVVTSSTSSKATFQFNPKSVPTAESTKTSPATLPSSNNIFGNLSKKPSAETSKPAETQKLSFGIPTTAPNEGNKPATPMFGMKTETSSSSELERPANTSNMFAFGSNKSSQNDVKTSSNTSSTVKPSQPVFMFGTKQEGFGSNLPSSTTNTLSSSSPSNVFKFGDTKTVSSGSGATSISSVSTQASVMTPKPNNVFSFGSNSEKKSISFGVTQTKETSTSSVGTTVTESKPVFGSFAPPSNNSTFGGGNTFGTSNLGNKDQPAPFAAQTTTVAFGTTTNTSTSSFQTFGQTNSFQPSQQESKPSPVFTFGSSAPQKEPTPSGGFVFNAGGFQSSQTQQNTATPSLFGFNNTTTASAPSSTFNFEPKFGSTAPGISPFNASASAPTPVFGAPTPQQAPSFGESATPAPMFNFGSQAAQQPQTPSNPVFEFGSNQQGTAATQQQVSAPTFMFGATAAPTPAAANPPAFDPNIKPTFNFTQGTGAPVFSAIPTVNSTGPAVPQNRKIRKAVRRTTPTVRN